MNNVWCDICNFLWETKYCQYTWRQHEKCTRCEEVKDKWPVLFDWVRGVVESKMDEHKGDYSHEYWPE